MKKTASTLKKVKSAGFTLVEMVIVIAIFGIITSIALFDQARLSSSVLLTNMAYEIGLAIREAQLYGISVRGSGFGEGDFAGASGAYISLANPKRVIIYRDGADSEVMGYTPGEERVNYEFQNQRTNRIRALCVGNLESGSAVVPCGQNPLDLVSEISIAFKRPNPAPLIFASDSPGGDMDLREGERAYIVVDTGDGQNCRVIVTEPTGQVRIVDSSSGLCTNN